MGTLPSKAIECKNLVMKNWLCLFPSCTNQISKLHKVGYGLANYVQWKSCQNGPKLGG
jgi:hypothetical protein